MESSPAGLVAHKGFSKYVNTLKLTQARVLADKAQTLRLWPESTPLIRITPRVHLISHPSDTKESQALLEL